MPELTDADLRDFAAGLREELAPVIFDSEDLQERLAEIWADDDYDIDLSHEVVAAVKADWFLSSALGMTFGTFGRMANAFGIYLNGRRRR